MSTLTREAAAATAFLFLACAGGGDGVRRDVDALRDEVQALRRDNDELSRRLDAVSGRLDVVTARLTRPPTAEPRRAADPTASGPVVPPDLAVVRVAPRRDRAAPPVPTSVPIAEPDPERLDALERRGRRDLAADADADLRAARRRSGLERAHALEDFAARYPHHPAADNALVEAAAAYAEGGKDEAACGLARRCADEYPAGDAMSDALERLAGCEARRGARDAERRLLSRIVADFPRTPAAQRAGQRLASISGRAGEVSPSADPARSGP